MTVISLDDSLRVISPQGKIEKVLMIDLYQKQVISEECNHYKFEDVKLVNLMELDYE